MAKGGNHRQYTEEWFLSRGYVKLADGSFQPPPFKNPFEKTANSEILVLKQKVNNSPDFVITPITEWFIKGYNVPSKKNSRQNFVRNGKQISIPSKKHAEYVKMTAMQYSVFGKEFRGAVQIFGLEYPLRIQFTFIRDSHRRFDYCNACQTVEDIMVSNEWLEDDSAAHLIPSFAPYEYDKNNPGVKIKLLR